MENYNKEAISVLNDLIETLKDGEKGFRIAAQGVDRKDIQQLFLKYAEQRSKFVDELQREVRKLGGDPDESGSLAGAIHRGWINIKSVVTGQDEESVLAECERGEDSAVRNYEEALKKNLPESVRSLIQKQYTQVKEAHDTIRDLEKRAELTKP